MKLLFDQNLSPRLIKRLSDLGSICTHVSLCGLERASDLDVWNYARSENCIIVTKDSDFNDLSIVFGSPPKVVWIRRENCSTSYIESILRKHYSEIESLNNDPDTAILLLY